ncbi:MAG TPA: CARDB domain-containing protein, partial [Phototrophicaceae bacterium]|nr:CARDB domain-containing protein [Phototrophicaceae bacterium]
GSYTVSAQAFRGDGSTSQLTEVKINVVDELPKTEPTATQPQPTVQPTNTIAQVQTTAVPTTSVPQNAATNTTAPTVPTATATANGVTVRIVKGGMNVRRGPSTNFEPPLGVLPGEQDVPVKAANMDATWFKITFNGADAWISSATNLVTVVSGDVNSLPREPGPPIPTLAPTIAPTSPPAATAGATAGSGGTSGANLVISNFVLDPADPFCNRTAQMRANISNAGNAATATGGFVVLVTENTDGSNRQTMGAVQIPVMTAGQQNFLIALDFKDTFVSNRADGVKRAILIIDPNNQIPESNDNDNTSAPDEFALGVPCDP